MMVSEVSKPVFKRVIIRYTKRQQPIEVTYRRRRIQIAQLKDFGCLEYRKAILVKACSWRAHQYFAFTPSIDISVALPVEFFHA